MDIKEIREKARLTDKELDNLTPTKKEVMKFKDGLTAEKVEGWDSLSEADKILTAFSILTVKLAVEAQITKYNNTEIAPEGECDNCWGSGMMYGVGVICGKCKGAKKLPPITVEQAIKKGLDGK